MWSLQRACYPATNQSGPAPQRQQPQSSTLCGGVAVPSLRVVRQTYNLNEYRRCPSVKRHFECTHIYAPLELPNVASYGGIELRVRHKRAMDPTDSLLRCLYQYFDKYLLPNSFSEQTELDSPQFAAPRFISVGGYPHSTAAGSLSWQVSALVSVLATANSATKYCKQRKKQQHQKGHNCECEVSKSASFGSTNALRQQTICFDRFQLETCRQYGALYTTLYAAARYIQAVRRNRRNDMQCQYKSLDSLANFMPHCRLVGWSAGRLAAAAAAQNNGHNGCRLALHHPTQ
ncbi:unnamed protein product [Ceratitis capitata]|uniref:(Mediterranean fruit fly) hypothetical protein n=1 Tax=Ceratitis capitata TaxID=7213 RepID=A0A811UHP1_CERCA|nr:unnamed protein product [Ceratitis capitata]